MAGNVVIDPAHALFRYLCLMLCPCLISFCKRFVVLGPHCLCRSFFSIFVVSSLNIIFGKFFTGGSLASLTVFFGDEVVVVAVCFCFLAVDGRLCHRGSDKLSSLSEVPCQLDDFSSFLPRGVNVLTSSGINPPLKWFTSCLGLIFCVAFI